MSDPITRARRFAEPYRIDRGKRFRMDDIDPDDRGDLTAEDKPRAQEALQLGIEAIAGLQDRLYAQDRWAVLLIFQAIDAAGKDSAIKHVMSGINPQGYQVCSFKAPTSEDLDHDYLWRCAKPLPVVAAAIADGLAGLNLQDPSVSKVQMREIARARMSMDETRGRRV